MTPAAPPIDGQTWMTSAPLSWDDLAGRAVVVVFWAHGCEASLLRLREVTAAAEAAAANGPVTVIGVHTPRLPYEEAEGPLRSVLAQHRIGIHVLHDPERLSWERYNPGGWPATYVIDPRGRALGAFTGTGDTRAVAQAIAVAQSTAASGAKAGRIPAAAALPVPEGDLAFPAAVDVMADGTLVVADAGHDRLLLFELADDRHRAVALAEIDGLDLPGAVAADRAQGIYVAEPRLGAVSFLDLAARNRQLLTDDLAAPSSLTLDIDLSLVVADGGADKLYRIVNGGPHNVRMGLIAGSGATGTRDGAAAEAELAQPCGLGRTDVGLVFCDAASNNLRLLTDRGKVATITGSGLFAWGLVDGPAHKARLQRPSDLAVLHDGSIVVADTGNNRIRRLANRRLRTLGPVGFDRPSGICTLPGGHLVVADTGNHRLVVVDPDLQTSWTLELEGVLPPPDLDPATLAGSGSRR